MNNSITSLNPLKRIKKTFGTGTKMWQD